MIVTGTVHVNEKDPRVPELIKDLDALGAQVSSGNKPAASKLADEIAERLNVLPVLVVHAGFRQCMLGKRPEAAVYLLGLSDMTKAMFENLCKRKDPLPIPTAPIIPTKIEKNALVNHLKTALPKLWENDPYAVHRIIELKKQLHEEDKRMVKNISSLRKLQSKNKRPV